jgi:transposase
MKERYYRLLLEESRKHSTSQQIRRRIEVLLLASEGHSNSEVSKRTGYTFKTVKARRDRWLADYDALLAYELGKDGKGVGDLELRRYLLSLLRDKARSGAPKVITPAQEQQIVALACDKPRKHGVEMTDWTHEMLALTAIAKGIVPTISSSQVGRILKNQPSSTS